MSTRVLPVGGFMNYSIRMSELRRRLQPPPAPVTQAETSQSQDQAPPPPPPQTEQTAPVHQTRSVRRNLFGPIDHDENLKFVQEELSKIADADSRRWNFDFQNDLPLEGRFTWETAKGANVPVAYEMPNLTSRLTQANPAPSTSKVINVVTSSSVTEPCSTDNPLRSTLQTVTTASTTVISSVIKPKPLDEGTATKSPSVTPDNPKPPKESIDAREKILPKKAISKISSKQTRITDFLKIRKRARSPSDTDSGKKDDAPSPPLLKRARTST